jgi:hypothetical protein
MVDSPPPGAANARRRLDFGAAPGRRRILYTVTRDGFA